METTLVKGLELIELLATCDEARGVTSLAKQMKLTKSNVHRLLTTLAAKGYVKRNELDSGYELSSKIWEIGVAVGSKFNLATIARPQMVNLAEQTGETVHLSILDEFEVLYIDKIESVQPIRSYTSVGGRAPAWCVATGKAMLSQSPIDLSSLRFPLPAFTKESITTKIELETELADTRMRGYAVNKGEWREGVFGLAASISDATGKVVGGIGISGPGARFKPREMRAWSALVVDAANIVSTAFGGGKAR